MNDTTTNGSIWAVLPIKDMSAAKQRLSPALAPHERRGLFAAMAEDVLSAIAAVDRFDGILVVTGDPDGRALAERYGAEVLSEAEDQGQTSAVTAAATALRARRMPPACGRASSGGRASAWTSTRRTICACCCSGRPIPAPTPSSNPPASPHGSPEAP